MDGMNIRNRILQLLKDNRYVFLILLLGICLMLIPEKKEKEIAPATEQLSVQQQSTEEKLSEILSHVQGAGKVKVLLTVERAEKVCYQYDEETAGADSRTVRTVVLTDSQKNQQGLVQQILSPQYRGAVVICQGADSAAVRYAILEAVMDATGLSSDRISVLKMK